MFQTFTEKSDPSQSASRIAALRARMAEEGIDALLVPHADEYQNEYLPERAERLAWLTGFTGSAGAAIILQDGAHVFTDGRYTLQVKAQTDPEIFTPQSLVDTPPAVWLENNLEHGARIGLDPWLHTLNDAERLRKSCEKTGGTLVPLKRNLIDAIRNDLPDAPLAPVTIHPHEFAGETPNDKIGRIAEALAEKDADAVVLTDPASICWLFNIRGSDVAHTPLALGFAILPARGQPELFIDGRKLSIRSEAYLAQLAKLYAPDDFSERLNALGAAGASVMLDPALAALSIQEALETAGATIVRSPDPVRIPRATKNAAEQKGARSAHRRDGAAMVTFLSWLDAQTPGTLDEIRVVRQLENARRLTAERLGTELKEISFDTISGSGPNGAIVHYRVTDKTNRTISRGDLLLVDSGAQYEDGTTDITRVVPVGQPSDEQRRAFTLVLKGMIAISRARFPEGTRGVDIDVLARINLWNAGLDYAHGTGHGVGSYLSVHEGPQTISKRGVQALLPGMILSNEPGYYKPGEFGIRIENLVLVRPAEVPEGGDLAMHGLETLTLCPIDRRMIDPALLGDDELAWLNDYHARVRDELEALIEEKPVIEWLEKMTAPIAR